MRDRQDATNMVDEMAARLGRLEEFALTSNGMAPPRRGATSQYPDAPTGGGQAEGAAIMRARNNQQGISPWMFVMATALNTMVAAVLAVLITLGVVRQEQAGGGVPRDISLAAASARASTTGLADDLPGLVTSSRLVGVRPI